jgi:lipopolysaccharide/colanic/teichoic acid biosynthesis glycosyltransferase
MNAAQADLPGQVTDRAGYEAVKRAADVALALFGLALLAPLMLSIAAVVRASSPGPIFYRGVRSGREGRPFRIFKFRSMVVGAEQGAGTTSRADARVTAVGRFLRKYKLDELPQLLNVLLGDMSFVGPRPELPRYTERYLGEETLILSIRPGITDFASLRFSNLNDLVPDEDPDGAFEANILPEKNALRLRYVRERSLMLDAKLICLTLARVFGIR